MTPRQPTTAVSRRAALAGLGTAGLGLALAAGPRITVAQDAATDMAGHPMVGTWLGGDGGGSMSQFGPDGLMSITGPANFVDGSGNLVFQSTAVGVWEPADARSVRFTAVWFRSDAAGTFTGTTTLDGYLEVSDDGQRWTDDLSHGSTFTDRDAGGAVTGEFVLDPSMPPATGLRIGVRNVPFPKATQATPAAGTPTT